MYCIIKFTLHVHASTLGTCSLASAKKMREHNGVEASESPDVMMYHSPERCLSVHLCVCLYTSLCCYKFVSLPGFEHFSRNAFKGTIQIHI